MLRQPRNTPDSGFLAWLPRGRKRKPVIPPHATPMAELPAQSQFEADLKAVTGGDWALLRAALEMRPQVGLDERGFQLLVLALVTTRQGRERFTDAVLLLETELAGGSWAWPAYDRWRSRFIAQGAWPVSWPWAEMAHQLAGGLAGREGLVIEAMPFLALRRLLKATGTLPAPLPKGRGAWNLAALEAAKVNHSLQAALSPWWLKAWEMAAAEAEAEKVRLLASTLGSMATRIAVTQAPGRASGRVVLADDFWAREAQVMAPAGGYPPYYPGDESTIIPE